MCSHGRSLVLFLLSPLQHPLKFIVSSFDFQFYLIFLQKVVESKIKSVLKLLSTYMKSTIHQKLPITEKSTYVNPITIITITMNSDRNPTPLDTIIHIIQKGITVTTNNLVDQSHLHDYERYISQAAEIKFINKYYTTPITI